MEALMDMAIDASFLFSYTNFAKLRINLINQQPFPLWFGLLFFYIVHL